MTYKIISTNARGMNDKNKRESIFDYFRSKVDILVVQETHSQITDEKIWESEWGGRAMFSHGTSASRGVAIFVTKKVYETFSNIYLDTNGRYIIVDFKQDDYSVTLVALYAPNQDSPTFFLEIGKELKERNEHKIVVGDFNLVLDVEADRLNTYHNNNKARDEVVNMMEEYSLRDIWRSHNETKKEYSWYKLGAVNKASRLDFALVSGGLDQSIKTCTYIPNIMSDHRAFYMALDTSNFERGCGYWKLNCNLLAEKDYITHVNKEVDLCLDMLEEKTFTEAWEIIKTRVKKSSIEYSKKRTSMDRLIIAELSEKIDEYESNLPLSPEQDKLLQETKADLEGKQIERVKGLIFRSKVRWVEGGEKNTKYFYALEKARYNAKTCYKLIDDENREISKPAEILKLQKDFYTDLYSEDKEVKFNLFNSYNIYVPEAIKMNQDEQITMSELEIAIKGMNNNKTPGSDGLPIEFYKVFWQKIKWVFFGMMIETFDQELLHKTARSGILNLIPKPNKDSRLIKNLRPITLLNTDYKIIEKAVANKILPALRTYYS